MVEDLCIEDLFSDNNDHRLKGFFSGGIGVSLNFCTTLPYSSAFIPSVLVGQLVLK